MTVFDNEPAALTLALSTIEISIRQDDDQHTPPYASLSVSDIFEGSSDNCPLQYSAERTSFSCSDYFAGEPVPVNASVIANDDRLDATVIVNLVDPQHFCENCTPDVKPPIALCVDNPVDVVLDSSGIGIVDASRLLSELEDNCPGIATTVVPAQVTCSDLTANNEPMSVLVLATDSSGNTASCVAQITVQDVDQDGDGFTVAGCDDAKDCNDDSVQLYPGRPWYRDEDADGFGTEDTVVFSCSIPVGYSIVAGDCDDGVAEASPALAEICGDAIDNDCDGVRISGCPKSAL